MHSGTRYHGLGRRYAQLKALRWRNAAIKVTDLATGAAFALLIIYRSAWLPMVIVAGLCLSMWLDRDKR
jgi:hypothetical protein